MSHLILKKVEGKYRIFNKENNLFQGPAIADEAKAKDILEWVDKKEDKEEDSEQIGIEEESKEHPDFKMDIIKKIVSDHLKMDKDYYKKD